MTGAEDPMELALPLPMEARLVSELPTPPGWQYEPKWDGFRAVVGRNGSGRAGLNVSSCNYCFRNYRLLLVGDHSLDLAVACL